MEPTLILHYAPDNASLVVRLALEHLRWPYRTVLVDRASREQKSAAYLRLNPNGLIPAVETPDGAIFETGAILLWLVDRHGGLGPAPDDPSRGDFLKWLFFLSNTVHADLRVSFYQRQYLGDDAPPDALALLRRQMQARFSAHLNTLEAVTATNRPWLAGSGPSAIDFYLACLARWRALYPRGQVGDFDLAHWPTLHALARRLETEPATLAAVEAEGLGPHPFTKPRPAQPPEGTAT